MQTHHALYLKKIRDNKKSLKSNGLQSTKQDQIYNKDDETIQST